MAGKSLLTEVYYACVYSVFKDIRKWFLSLLVSILNNDDRPS